MNAKNTISTFIESKIEILNSLNLNLQYDISISQNSDFIKKLAFINLINTILEKLIENSKQIKNKSYKNIKINIFEEKNTFLFFDIYSEIKPNKINAEFDFLYEFTKKYFGDLATIGIINDNFIIEISIPLKNN